MRPKFIILYIAKIEGTKSAGDQIRGDTGFRKPERFYFYIACSIYNDACYWVIQTAAVFNFVIKYPGGRDLNKCQIPGYLGLNSRQIPEGCPGVGVGKHC